MKHFWIKSEIVLSDFNVCAYDNRRGTFVDAIEIPEGKRLKVVLKDGLDEIRDNLKIVQRAAKRSFILFDGNKPVGWATFHRDKNAELETETEAE